MAHKYKTGQVYKILGHRTNEVLSKQIVGWRITIEDVNGDGDEGYFIDPFRTNQRTVDSDGGYFIDPFRTNQHNVDGDGGDGYFLDPFRTNRQTTADWNLKIVRGAVGVLEHREPTRYPEGSREWACQQVLAGRNVAVNLDRGALVLVRTFDQFLTYVSLSGTANCNNGWGLGSRCFD